MSLRLPNQARGNDLSADRQAPETERRCVHVRVYEVRVFVPKVLCLEAQTEEEALEKVGKLYQELYAKDIRTWIERLPEPEDCA